MILLLTNLIQVRILTDLMWIRSMFFLKFGVTINDFKNFTSLPSVHFSIYGAAWLSMVRRGSVGSGSACWKAGPSSILGSAPQGGFSPLSTSAMRRGLGEWRWMYECDLECMY